MCVFQKSILNTSAIIYGWIFKVFRYTFLKIAGNLSANSWVAFGNLISVMYSIFIGSKSLFFKKTLHVTFSESIVKITEMLRTIHILW